MLVAAVAAAALTACNSEEVRDVPATDSGGREVVMVDGMRLRLVEIVFGTGIGSEKVHCLTGGGGDGHVLTCWPV